MPLLRRLSWVAALAAAVLLSACSTLPRPALPERTAWQDFALTARFALTSRQPGEAEQKAGGRLDWRHQNDEDEILIANPIGIGLARLDSRPGEARLETGDGRRFVADDPEQLLFDVLGQALPVRQLPRWLLGRASADGQLQRDPQGRPSRLEEAGWRIDYSYDDEAPGSLPSRLHLRQGEHIDLRLRIEEWKSAP